MNINFYRLNKTKKLLQLWADETIVDENKFLDKIASQLVQDTDIIQFENKNVTTEKFVNLAKKIKLLCAEFSKIFIVVDRCDVALLVNSDGLFIPQNSLDINFCRHLLGEEKIIGTYISDFQQFEEIKSQTDYVIFDDTKLEDKIKQAKIPYFILN